MPDQQSGDSQKDPQRGTQNQKLLKMKKEDLDLLAEKLGGEIVDIQEYAAAIRALPAISKILRTGGALKGFKVPTIPKHLPKPPTLPTPKTVPTPPKPFPTPEPAPKPVPHRPGQPTKPTKPTEPAPKPVPQPKPGTPTKPGTKPGTPTKPGTKPGTPTKPTEKGGVVVPGTKKGNEVEPKTSPLPSPKATPKTQKTPPIVGTPGGGGGGGGTPKKGGRLPVPRCTKAMQLLGLCSFPEPGRSIGVVRAKSID